ncbi:ubiquinone biosynthesis protein UbiJ [Alteromonadaceae bacterium 2753L.S.0a.02]|nr:ubiquinone biosynthesis protein UbiJ [Alteromonadaceae bacterium 2753L.S.0a.02]
MSEATNASSGNFNEMPSLLAQLLQETVNKVLRYDPGTRAALQKLPSAPLAIISQQPLLTLYIKTRDDQLEFGIHNSEPAAVELSGKLSDIISLVFTAKTSLANTGVTVRGSIGLLADYQRCFQNIEIDWEDALARAIGSLPAHQLATFGRNLFNTLLPGRTQSADWLRDFIVEELEAVPSNAQLEQFSQELNRIRQNTDRLQLRIKKLIHQQQQQ